MKTIETRWGFYTVYQEFNRGEKVAKIKSIYIEPNKNISYQTHKLRGELWTIIGGSGTFVQDGNFFEVEQGSSMMIPKGSKHSIKAGDEGLEFIEVQFGDDCIEEDIDRIYMDWKDVLRQAGGDE